MFTGLVEDIGRIAEVSRQPDAAVLEVEPAALPTAELTLGESVAIDGVCLTVTEKGPSSFTVLAGAETLARTALGDRRAGDRVNLERALRMGDRLGGHLVQGHVDGVGEVIARSDEGANLVVGIRPPADLLRLIVVKGSISIDGISLTVNSVDSDGLSVALIPHTVSHTTLADRAVGDRVHVEVDMIGKYVDKLLTGYREHESSH